MPNNTSTFSPLDIDPWIACPVCSAPIGIPPNAFREHFMRDAVDCPASRCHLDWWKTILTAIEQNFMLTGAFAVFGARTAVYTSSLHARRATLLRFRDGGVPEDAIVLSVNLTSQGPIGAALLCGNVVKATTLSNEIRITGFPLTNSELESTNVTVAVTWLARSPNDVVIEHLAQATRAYCDGRYRDVVIPANVAAESAIGGALAAYTVSHCDGSDKEARKRTDDFLVEASYSYQLNPLLAIVAASLGVPNLSKSIRAALDRLRRLRNDLAHRGRLRRESQALQQSDAALFLSAALFAFHYGLFLESRMSPETE